MAAKKKVTAKKAAPKKAAVKKKPAAKKKTAAKKNTTAAPKKAVAADLATLDRKALAGRAREIKRELMAIRFNLQSPSLADYRKKKKELSKVLGHLS
ncbi:hypothetical protein GW915_04590 [bacterium]|nr:hypothetical protein [bacterium]